MKPEDAVQLDECWSQSVDGSGPCDRSMAERKNLNTACLFRSMGLWAKGSPSPGGTDYP